MTLRAKPVVKRRSSMDSNERRNLLTNIGFGLVVVAAIVILIATAAMTWYNDHLATVGSVNGTNITVDQLRDRVAIERFRLDYAASRVSTDLAAGRISEADAQQVITQLDQRRQQLGIISLERLIDIMIIEQLATEENVSASDDEVSARLLTEKTIVPTRHAWVIEVAPELTPGVTEPTAEQVAAARAKAAAAVAELNGGAPWEDVARKTSTASSALQAGDLGWIGEEQAGIDAKALAAVFAAEANDPSDVIEGEDGSFYVVRATEIDPGSVDGTFEARLEEAAITIEQYRAAVRVDALRQKLEDKVVADALKPAPQRRVAEIYLRSTGTTPPADALKTRHILYAPKDDPGAAADLPDDDPFWEAARVEAQATYDKLRADPSKFDEIARAESDENSARQTGGKLPYFDATSAVDPAFLAALQTPGLEPGDLIKPFKSSFGYHVVQVMHGPPDLDWARELKKQVDNGADFDDLVRDNSDGIEAQTGGVVGWIARGELDDLSETAIFGLQVGQVSDPVEVAGDGVYLYKVLAEEVRAPSPDQEATIRATAYSAWYAERKNDATKFTITRDQAVTTTIS